MWVKYAGIDVTEFTYRDGCLVEHMLLHNKAVGVRWNSWSLSSAIQEGGFYWIKSDAESTGLSKSSKFSLMNYKSRGLIGGSWLRIWESPLRLAAIWFKLLISGDFVHVAVINTHFSYYSVCPFFTARTIMKVGVASWAIVSQKSSVLWIPLLRSDWMPFLASSFFPKIEYLKQQAFQL
jgi:hypothetical protein